MPLDQDLADIADRHMMDREALSAILFGLCWPGESALAPELAISARSGESLPEMAERLDLPWNPGWLLEAGYIPYDSFGHAIAAERATSDGPITWQPEARICRLDDQTRDGVEKTSAAYRRRITGEVALLALWSRSAKTYGVGLDIRPVGLGRNTRGARFKDLLVHYLSHRLPPQWKVLPEVSLTSIRGLHMRKNVGGRKSDIVVIDEGNRLVAVISSKWTWRSDRGTEAAQMVPLARYRPDVPYALVTAEFPRAATVSKESIEDRAYHVCPIWVGAWLAIYQAQVESPRKSWPSLDSLQSTGEAIADALGLADLNDLVEDLQRSGEIL